MARYDLRDPFCLPTDGNDWCDSIEPGVAGLTVGILWRLGFDAPADADAVAAVERAAHLLSSAGASVEEAVADLPDPSVAFSRIWGAALSWLVASTPVPPVVLNFCRFAYRLGRSRCNVSRFRPGQRRARRGISSEMTEVRRATLPDIPHEHAAQSHRARRPRAPSTGLKRCLVRQ